MKKRATFLVESTLLTDAAAVTAWREQAVRCPCGHRGDAEHAVAGAAGDMPAKWLGCANPTHAGQALGRPLIYRLPSQMGQPARK